MWECVLLSSATGCAVPSFRGSWRGRGSRRAPEKPRPHHKLCFAACRALPPPPRPAPPTNPSCSPSSSCLFHSGFSLFSGSLLTPLSGRILTGASRVLPCLKDPKSVSLGCFFSFALPGGGGCLCLRLPPSSRFAPFALSRSVSILQGSPPNCSVRAFKVGNALARGEAPGLGAALVPRSPFPVPRYIGAAGGKRGVLGTCSEELLFGWLSAVPDKLQSRVSCEPPPIRCWWRGRGGKSGSVWS